MKIDLILENELAIFKIGEEKYNFSFESLEKYAELCIANPGEILISFEQKDEEKLKEYGNFLSELFESIKNDKEFKDALKDIEIEDAIS